MVLTLKRWKSRASPGITADGHGIKTHSHVRASRPALEGPVTALFAFSGLAFHSPGPTWDNTSVAGWSSPVARQAHNLKVAGSNPAPATKLPASMREQASLGRLFCYLAHRNPAWPTWAIARSPSGRSARSHKGCLPPRQPRRTGARLHRRIKRPDRRQHGNRLQQ